MKILFIALLLGLVFPVAAQDSPPTGTWRSATDMPTLRSEITAAALDNKIYVAGGLLANTVSSAFEVYDSTTDSWSDAADLPVPLHHTAMTAVGGQIYLAGGYETGFRPTIDALWAYDSVLDAWEQITEMPAPRAAHTLVAVDDRLYVIGGVGPDSHQLWTYDLTGEAWSTDLAPLPTRREHLAAVALDGKIVVIAGRWNGINLPVVEAYDPATDTWTSLPDLPTPRSGLTAAVVKDRIHVTGGEALNSSLTFDQHEVYDSLTNSWETFPPLPTARHGLTSVAVADRWHVIGGATGAGGQTFTTLSAAMDIFETLDE